MWLVLYRWVTYVYELIHVYVVTLSLSDSVVNFEVIEWLIVFVWYPVSMDTAVSLLHPQLSMLIKLFFDIYTRLALSIATCANGETNFSLAKQF